VALLNKHLREIIAAPEYRKLIEDTGSIPESSTPAELRAIMDQTFEELAPTIKEFGLQRD
jgi:tripartite-type tricarboxylate transporter receptor subunit TctC